MRMCQTWLSYPQKSELLQASTSHSAWGCITIERQSLTHHPEIKQAIIHILFWSGFEYINSVDRPLTSPPTALLFISV